MSPADHLSLEAVRVIQPVQGVFNSNTTLRHKRNIVLSAIPERRQPHFVLQTSQAEAVASPGQSRHTIQNSAANCVKGSPGVGRGKVSEDVAEQESNIDLDIALKASFGGCTWATTDLIARE